MNKYEFAPEIWFEQNEQQYFTNKYIHAYLVCGIRWKNEPLVMGKRFNVHIRDSFDKLSDYYTKNDPRQNIIHPIAVRLSLREIDNIQDPIYRKTHYPEILGNSYYLGFLPKEIPEITCHKSHYSHGFVSKDSQEYGYSTEVATAILYWAYKIAGLLDAHESIFDIPKNRTIPHSNTFDLRMKEIHECYPDMWKIAAFTNWPKWEDQKVKLNQRVEILKNLGFDFNVSDLKRECSFFGIKRSIDLE